MTRIGVWCLTHQIVCDPLEQQVLSSEHFSMKIPVREMSSRTWRFPWLNRVNSIRFGFLFHFNSSVLFFGFTFATATPTAVRLVCQVIGSISLCVSAPLVLLSQCYSAIVFTSIVSTFHLLLRNFCDIHYFALNSDNIPTSSLHSSLLCGKYFILPISFGEFRFKRRFYVGFFSSIILFGIDDLLRRMPAV